MKQKPLFKLKEYSSEFGGSLLKGHRKSSRPLSRKNALKVVLRGDIKKSGSLLKHKGVIDQTFATFSEKFKVRIYEKAIVGNHIHFMALFSSRSLYAQFIRALTGTLAKKIGILWIFRPWSRIVSWGHAFLIARKYIIQNHLEATKVIPYQPRKKQKVE